MNHKPTQQVTVSKLPTLAFDWLAMKTTVHMTASAYAVWASRFGLNSDFEGGSDRGLVEYWVVYVFVFVFVLIFWFRCVSFGMSIPILDSLSTQQSINP